MMIVVIIKNSPVSRIPGKDIVVFRRDLSSAFSSFDQLSRWPEVLPTSARRLRPQRFARLACAPSVSRAEPLVRRE